MASLMMRSVSKWYGNVVAVSQVSLEVEPGSRVCWGRTVLARPRCCT